MHAEILAARVAELRAAERLHRVFTDLAVAGASAQQVVEQASALAGVPVVVADLAHRVLACCAVGRELAPVLTGFAGRSRSVRVAGPCGYDRATGWLVARVGDAPDGWGRVILVVGEPSPADFVLAERAAEALTLARLTRAGLGRDDSPLRVAHQELLTALVAGHCDSGDLGARLTALGVPITGHRLLPIVVAAAAEARDLAEAVGAGCGAAAVPALVGVLGPNRAAALLALPTGADPDHVLTRLAALLRAAVVGHQPVLGAGLAVATLAEARMALRAAEQAASAAVQTGAMVAPPTGIVRLANLRLPGLMYQLREDPAVLAFAERELGPLTRHDEAAGTDLVGVLACYLACGGNKAQAAHQAGLARPTLYERLRSIEQILGTKLDSPESRLALYVALLALSHQRSPGLSYRADQDSRERSAHSHAQ